MQPSVGSHGPSCGQGLLWPLTSKQVSIPCEALPSRALSPGLVGHQGKGAPPSEISTSLGVPVCAVPSGSGRVCQTSGVGVGLRWGARGAFYKRMHTGLCKHEGWAAGAQGSLELQGSGFGDGNDLLNLSVCKQCPDINKR